MLRIQLTDQSGCNEWIDLPQLRDGLPFTNTEDVVVPRFVLEHLLQKLDDRNRWYQTSFTMGVPW